MALLPVDEALKQLLSTVDTLAFEMSPLNEATGRILAAPISARLTQPPFNPSAMDGYACHASDLTQVPCKLKLVGEAAAGHSFDSPIKSGEAIRIFTGAPVPDDLDCVVIQENTNRIDQETVEILSAPTGNRNIRKKGGDFNEGDIVLEKGHLLTPASLALCAAAGQAEIPVIKRPKIAILSTGDELVPAGSIPQPNQIVASNAHALYAVANSCGVDVIDLGIAKDNKPAIKAALQSAKDQNVDLILSSGGVSVGDYDLVQTVLKEEGMNLNFWKIALRPGKPLMFGQLPDKTLVIGLPGNPASTLTTCHLFVVPVLKKLSGLPYQPNIQKAKLTAPLKANGERRHYIAGKFEITKDNTYQVTPVTSYDSSLLKTMASSNCMIIHYENAPALGAGDECDIFIPEHGI